MSANGKTGRKKKKKGKIGNSCFYVVVENMRL